MEVVKSKSWKGMVWSGLHLKATWRYIEILHIILDFRQILHIILTLFTF